MYFVSRTHKGNVRTKNEDSVLVYNSNKSCFAAVADGMGGHNTGDVASALAVKVASAELKKGGSASAKTLVVRAVEKANTEIYRQSQANEAYRNMGTTLALALLFNTHYVAANVGDSRIYHIHDNEIEQVSVDHSYVAELVALGYITKEEAVHHPRRNLITRALGTRESEKVDIFERTWTRGDMLVLCSDGLYSELEDDDILKTILSADSLEQACEDLVDCAIYSGSKDNVSIVLALNEEETV